MKKHRIQTVFAHSWPLALAGMAHTVGHDETIELTGLYSSIEELTASLDTVDCDVAIVDYTLDGLTLLDKLRHTHPDVRIVALVTHESPVILRSILSWGITSIVSKLDDSSDIVTGIHASHRGYRYVSPTVTRMLDSTEHTRADMAELSRRESEVVRLYLSGIPIKTIAQQLRKGKQTISAQKVSAMRKLGVTNDVELVRQAVLLGLRIAVDTTTNRVQASAA